MKKTKTATFKLPDFFNKNMVEITLKNTDKFLSFLGFNLKNGEEMIYSKKYPDHKDYEILIKVNEDNFRSSKISYGNKITIGRKTTCNFSQQENFVILECVNRLLEKGYAPDKIVLEKNFPLGHNEGGNLDIQILDDKNKSFLMIECKTWGGENKKEENKIYNNGGQLFSYFNQDRDTKYLCLYASIFDDEKILYNNSIIKIVEDMKNASNKLECYENWKPQIFEKNGIFEEEVNPYSVNFVGLKKFDLRPLTKEDGGDIFNRFAEILRKNVISDKTNAYNKIFNLFLCKIVDEYERNDEEMLKFQWQNSETNEEVLLRLNGLYKQGMKEYLDLKISAIDMEEVEEQLKNVKTEQDRGRIRKLFIEQKLYTSNDFAFKEVFDKNTFDLNCIVVKEVVKLLEQYKIKYETKQQFLGDFFEKLLNTGIKQEAGQFFTPVPIAQFIAKSLPIWDIMKEKNNNKEIYFLPSCIDYASGAGHFLTETMEEINYYIEKKISTEFIKNGRAKKEFNYYKDNFKWAEKYIYGIEKDYRLAKTTKIATFLNGDGEAIVICGDGLDNFNKSKNYRQKLKLSENKKDNEVFDIVVANPPYSISGFKTAISYGKESFDLYDYFTDKSKEIECLFIERTKQLLKEGGVAGIVLPTSILEGEKIYSLVRELILQNFEVKGIVRLGKNTFMATSTSAIILFIKKIKNKSKDIIYYIKKSIKEKKDLSINGIENPIKNYLKQTYKIDFKKYIDFFENNNISNAKLNKIKIYNSYIEYFKKQNKIKKISEFVTKREINKLLYFILSYNKKVILYTIPLDDTKEEKKTLGYGFSDRKGYEGIHITKLGGKLYNPKNLYDESKLNSYILNNFQNKEIEINGEIPNLHYINLNEIIDFNDGSCSKVININKFDERKNKTSENAKKALLKLKEEKVKEKVEELIKKYSKETKIDKLSIRSILKEPAQTGGTPHTRSNEFWEGGDIPWLKIGDMNSKYVHETEKMITELGRKSKHLKIFKKGTLLFSIFATIGKIGILKIETTLNQAICALIPDKNKVLTEYLYYILLLEREKIAESRIHRTQDNINQTKLEKWEIPIIKDLKQQQKFIDEVNAFEKTISL